MEYVGCVRRTHRICNGVLIKCSEIPEFFEKKAEFSPWSRKKRDCFNSRSEVRNDNINKGFAEVAMTS